MTTVNPSPKTRFQEQKALVDQHKRLIERNDLQTSIDYALLQYQSQLVGMSDVLNGNSAAASHFRLLGAHEFIQVFKTLAEQHVPTVVKPQDNLNHRV